MFRKEKPVPPATVTNQTEKEPSVQEQQKSTVIASGVHFEGNITASGQIYIYGEVYGNVVSNGGQVKIMRNGLVKGNIACGTLVIDGTLIGECKSESIDIHEHGKIDGSLAYTTLSVKNGGVFVGKAETFTKPDSEINVITFVSGEMITPLADDIPCNATGTN
ncbi:polymer-forming cytoskeletal protein [Buttiauxella sp. 3AFRM03]|uniref:bactofilin family protein n=1 Tax=Buttiauxella sp. 3AFRM03 TaxID=2479367 RepID=UPI0013904907|nr:polymer-forming cytoskeletal protein [Buttiauxella sp. 3AFRM03]